MFMSVLTDSPVHSSSSDDFAAFLDEELDTESCLLSNEVDEDGYDTGRKKKRPRMEIENTHGPSESEVVVSIEAHSFEASSSKQSCPHPGFFRDLCIACGSKVDDGGGVAFGYIHKDLRLGSREIARLRTTDVKNLIRHKKLYLILDLDHTLLNSTHLGDLTPEEEYLRNSNVTLQGSLFTLDHMHTITKLRPYVQAFLKEASEMFEMYIYTMGERAYAHEMARLLDPQGIYFNSRIISKNESTQRNQKGLDIVLGQEGCVLIIDDTEYVWQEHRSNLILVERYHFFSSSCRQFGFASCKSMSEMKSDECGTDGSLVAVLRVLKRVHNKFFSSIPADDFHGRDVRHVLKDVRKEVLEGCRVVFSGIFSSECEGRDHPLWGMAEQLGATCQIPVGDSVSHVITTNARTEKSLWALRHDKFLVHPRWLETAYYLWARQSEPNFPVGPL